MKKLNSALAQNGILKSIALVMLVLVATFGVALSMGTFTNSSEIGGRSTTGESALSYIGGSKGVKGEIALSDIGGKNSQGGLENSLTSIYEIGGKGAKGTSGEFAFSAIGGRSQAPSYECSFCVIGGKNPSTGQYSVCFDELNTALNLKVSENKSFVLSDC
jgi:hypothetical protein